MVKGKNGLGDCYYYEVKDVEAKLQALKKKGDEVSFTEDYFLSEQLYDTVIEALEKLGFACVLKCSVHRWFVNKETKETFRCDFRNDVIIVRKELNCE